MLVTRSKVSTGTTGSQIQTDHIRFGITRKKGSEKEIRAMCSKRKLDLYNPTAVSYTGNDVV
ncbi:UNVERIFIED_CONTAM: hypothetical protein FKN15_049272 [Acipenser sinensis]